MMFLYMIVCFTNVRWWYTYEKWILIIWKVSENITEHMMDVFKAMSVDIKIFLTATTLAVNTLKFCHHTRTNTDTTTNILWHELRDYFNGFLITPHITSYNLQYLSKASSIPYTILIQTKHRSWHNTL